MLIFKFIHLFGCCTCQLLSRQDVADQRQSMAGHADQSSVIENNTATAGNDDCGPAVYI